MMVAAFECLIPRPSPKERSFSLCVVDLCSVYTCSHQVSELDSRAVAAEGREEPLTQKLAESQAARDRVYQECVQSR